MQLSEEMQLSNEDLVKLIRAGRHERMIDLYEQNKGMIRREARRYVSIGGSPAVDIDDFMQTGYLALAAAVAAYDENRGSFITVLVWKLKNHMRLLCGLRGARKAHNGAVSLDEPMPGSDEVTRGVMLVDENAEDPCDAAELDDLRRIVRTAVSRLPDKQRNTIERYYFGHPYRRDHAAYFADSALKDSAIIRLRRDTMLRRLVAASNTTIYRHVGLSRYRSSWDSAVELAVIRREELQEEIKELMRWHSSTDAAQSGMLESVDMPIVSGNCSV